MTHTRIGLFNDRRQANLALERLLDSGITPREVSVLATDRDGEGQFAVEQDTKASEGAGVGGVVGGAAGALLAGVAATATVTLPGVGLLAAGPIAAALAGAGAGGATGTLIGSLVGLGMTENEAKLYSDSVKKGNFMVGVQTESKASAKDADVIFDECDALNYN